MKQLILLRGAPACGKTTLIKELGWDKYVLSADDIRMQISSPILNKNGEFIISQKVNKIAWDLLFVMLEERMKSGSFTVIDATNSKKIEMSNYKDLASTYGYRVFLIDMTDIPIDVVKQQNKDRAVKTPYKWVPEEVIENMYSRFSTQGVPGYIKVIDRYSDIESQVLINKFDMNKYNEIIVIGDIHGSYVALMDLIQSQGGLKDDCFYCFCGDYLDRGNGNLETIKYLLDIYNKKNVLLLEGNHEKHIRDYANSNKIASKEFIARTKKELESDESLTKKSLRMFCRTLAQCAYFNFGPLDFFISHGGISKFDKYIPTSQLIKGVGEYEEMVDIAKSWDNYVDNVYVKENGTPIYQVFGHRNVSSEPIFVGKYNICLEDNVEFGGQLRAIKINKDGLIQDISVKNRDFNSNYEKVSTSDIDKISIEDFVSAAKSNRRMISIKDFDGVSSFNFTREAFTEKVWNDMTVTARGLFIDEENNSIVARGFQKFFNIGERHETELYELAKTLKFPVKTYLKENGFLGLVSIRNGEFFFTSKTSINSEHSKYLKDIFEETITDENKEKIKQYLKKNKKTLIFEVMDPENDPHIIKYDSKHLVLLDIVDNTLKFNNISFKDLNAYSKSWGVKCKRLVNVIKNIEDFKDFVASCDKYEYKDSLTNSYVEGYVFVDSNGFMTKLKTKYYNLWKHMRAILTEVKNKGYSNRTGSLLEPIANFFYSWLVGKVGNTNKEQREEIIKDIVFMRDLFFKEN